MRVLVLIAAVALPVAGGQELIERTLALVGGQPITLNDARAAMALGLIAVPASGDRLSAAAAELIDRELVLREVQRYAPPAPSAAAIDARLDVIRQKFPPGALDRVLESHGFTGERLRAWVRDDLRVQAYLDQRFASASAPTDADLSAAYARQRAEFEQAGLTFEQALPALRDRVAAERRAELITDWISELRRRTDVVLLTSQ